jgi:hypothetical protein
MRSKWDRISPEIHYNHKKGQTTKILCTGTLHLFQPMSMNLPSLVCEYINKFAYNFMPNVPQVLCVKKALLLLQQSPSNLISNLVINETDVK